MSIKHTSLAEVRQTIRKEIATENQYIASFGASPSPMYKAEILKAQNTINAYRSVLHWLADLEA